MNSGSTAATGLRIAFLPFYVPYYEGSCSTFGVEKRAICERLARVLGEFGEVIWDGKMVQEEGQAAEGGAKLATVAPDCAVVFTSIAVFASIPMAALRPIRCPILLWNAQQIESVSGGYTMVEIVRNTGQIGTQALANALMREGRPFRVLTGYEGAGRTREGLAGFFGSVRAVKTLRSARLLAVGDPFTAMLDIAADDGDLRSRLGIEVVHIGAAEWTKRYESVPASEVKRRVTEIVRDHPVSDIGEDEMQRSARLAEALAGLVEEHRAVAGTVNCHIGNCMRNPSIGITACYSLGDQNGRGRPFTCTGDIPTAIAMLLLKALTGVSMYTEVQVMDEKRQAIVIANSGEGEPGIRREGAPCAVRGNTNFCGLHGRGLSFAYPLAPGPATIVSFTPTPSGPKPYRLIVAEGSILPEPLPDAGALAGFFQFRHVSLHDGYTKWLEAGPVHHAATTRGHWSRELKDIAGWIEAEAVSI